jgi:hypothetical protein
MSTLRVNTIQNSGGTGSPAISGLAAAWVNFNGTGTVAIRASNNVSSITDNGTGSYTVNFTTALSDSNYAINCTSGFVTGIDTRVIFNINSANFITTSNFSVYAAITTTGATVDPDYCCVSVFR